MACSPPLSSDKDAQDQDSSTTERPFETGFTEPPDTILYVAHGVDGDGSDWQSPLGSIHQALDVAASLGDAWIWVKEGTYTPGNAREDSFVLRPGVGLFGGFRGDETTLDERDWQGHPTILSGEIGDANTYRDNSFHVVNGADDALLDGFIVEKGFAFPQGGYTPDGDVSNIIDAADPDASILRILEGVEVLAGAGMYNIHAAPVVRHVEFRDNHAGKGGAVYNMVSREFPLTGDAYPAARFVDVVFRDNTAADRGGAVNNDLYTSPLFINTVFEDNICDEKGGAVYNDMESSPGFVNVLMVGNWAERGGALANDGTSSPRLTYVTVLDNSAYDLGGALYQGTYVPNSAMASPTNANQPVLTSTLVLGNDTVGAPASISNWHDGGLILDEASVVEHPDGTLDRDQYIDGGGASLIELGWHPDRVLEDPDALVDPDVRAAYPGFDYDTSSSGGGDGVLYVKSGGGGDGSSWNRALGSLSEALNEARRGHSVWVALGTWKPSGSERTASFVIPEGVSVYGGFCGDENQLGQRDISGCATVLDGNIGNSQATSDNAYHVVVGSADSRLDGVTVRNGVADGDWHHGRGGGLIAYHEARLTLSEVTFEDNQAIEGGALVAYDQSHVIMESCILRDNSAVHGGGAVFRFGSNARVSDTTLTNNEAVARGGAVVVDYGSNTSFTDVTFSGNASQGNGGAVYIDDNESQFGDTHPSFDGCTFRNNTTNARGGGLAIFNSESRATISGGSFTGNEARHGGGAMAVDFYSTVVLNNVQMSGNTSTNGDNDIDVEDSATVN